MFRRYFSISYGTQEVQPNGISDSYLLLKYHSEREQSVKDMTSFVLSGELGFGADFMIFKV